MAAIQGAIDAGADWVEIDVQETVDGEIVVIHDSDLKKIGGNAMKVADSTLAELQGVDIGSWFGPEFSDQRIPTLKQVLERCKGRIGVNIELKYYGKERRLEESVAGIVEAVGMQDQVLVMSLNYNGIKKMRELRPGWSVGLLSTVALGDVIGLDVDFLALNAKSTSRAKVRNIQNRDKQVMVWTVNDAVGMSVMFGRGVDAIITDEPALAVSVLEQRKKLNPAERLLMHLADVFDQPSMYREQ
jgi:glycerophosphoryl diester phosphodiesterase